MGLSAPAADRQTYWQNDESLVWSPGAINMDSTGIYMQKNPSGS